MSIYKEIFNILDNLIDLGNYQQYYPEKASKNDRIRRFALIAHDEFIFAYSLQGHKINKLINPPALDECPAILLKFYNLYSANPQYTINQIKIRNGRKKEYQSIRYKKLKQLYQSIEQVPFCFKCWSKRDIELDHIKNHFSFKFEKLAYDLSNLQYLCHNCNNAKGPLDNTDYRTEGQVEMINRYIKDMLNDNPIVS